MEFTENEESDQRRLMSSSSNLEEGSSGGGGVDLTLRISPPSSMSADHQPLMPDNLNPSHFPASQLKIGSSQENEETEGSLSCSSFLKEGRSSGGTLGLKFDKTPSFINLVQSTLDGKARQQKAQQMPDRFKASHIPASKLKIGSWQRISKNEGDLTAKIYYGKRKLGWEILQGGLKSKIEMNWSDISAISAHTPDNDYARLEIQLSQKPCFFRETDPQPRKPTSWDEAPDFTEGREASVCRRHTAFFPPGMLKTHYEQLIYSDKQLSELSNKLFPSHENPYFDQSPHVPRPTGYLPPVPVFPPPQFNAMNPRTPMFVTNPLFIKEGGRKTAYENQWGNQGVNNKKNQLSNADWNIDSSVNTSMYQHAPPHDQGSNDEGMDLNALPDDQGSNDEGMDVNSSMNTLAYPNVQLPEPTMEEDFAAGKSNDHQGNN